MTAREVIARGLICDWQTADEGSREYALDSADAILAALSAAPDAVRLDLARRLAGDAHRVVPVEPTREMLIAAGASPDGVCARGGTDWHGKMLPRYWRAMLAAAQEDQR